MKHNRVTDCNRYIIPLKHFACDSVTDMVMQALYPEKVHVLDWCRSCCGTVERKCLTFYCMSWVHGAREG